MHCPCCKGTGQQNLTITTHGESDSSQMSITCIVCHGHGTLSKEDYRDYQDAMSLWCECGNPSEEAAYVPDNASPDCAKHHWTCADCGKITQVG